MLKKIFEKFINYWKKDKKSKIISIIVIIGILIFVTVFLGLSIKQIGVIIGAIFAGAWFSDKVNKPEKTDNPKNPEPIIPDEETVEVTKDTIETAKDFLNEIPRKKK